MAQPTSPFEWSASEIRDAGAELFARIAEHLSTLPRGPVFRPVPPALAARAQSEAPHGGVPLAALFEELEQRLLPHPFGNGHPRFFGWVNSPPAPVGVVAAAMAAAINPSVAGGNHGAVYIEREVLDWFKQIVGWPAAAGGLLVSGGSAGALTALTVARHQACAGCGWNVRTEGLQDSLSRPRLVIYAGEQVHGCHQKAIELLGLGSRQIRTIASDAALRLRPDALDQAIAEDVKAGYLPVAVIATAGTVNTGVIDPLASIADVCARYGVWLHVDGAYGAPARLLADFEPELAALARADSVAMDPHKWLYVPVDCGVVLIRDAAAMRDAFSLVPPYLRTDGDPSGVQGPPWFSEFGFEQTRPFRALKAWMTLKYFGLDGYRDLLAHDVASAARLAERVRATPALELWTPCGLSIVCFRVRPARGLTPDAGDALNRRVLEAVQLSGQAFLSSTVLAGRLWLRACIVNPRTLEADVDALLAAVVDAVDRVG